MTFFDRAAKMVPVICVAAGAVAGAFGSWQATREQLRELGGRNERTEKALADHVARDGHDSWFGPGVILYPALRLCIERLIDDEVHKHLAEYQRTIAKPFLDAVRRMNPALVLPDVTEYR